MPISIDPSRWPIMPRLLTALLLTGLLPGGLFPAGCSSVKAPPAATLAEEPPAEALWDRDAQSVRDVPVESWADLEFDEFNTTVDAAVDSGGTWARNPIDVVERFIRGEVGEAFYTRMEKQDNRVEWPDSTVITLIRDRWADDSVRGDWHEITLYRLPDGTWRISEARRAFRCYRGHQQAVYGKRLCL